MQKRKPVDEKCEHSKADDVCSPTGSSPKSAGHTGGHDPNIEQVEQISGQLNQIDENVSYLLEENQALQTLIARIIEHMAPENGSEGSSQENVRANARVQGQKDRPQTGRLLTYGNRHHQSATVRTWVPREF